MPRYYFQLHDGGDDCARCHGVHRDFSAARTDAVRQLAERLIAAPGKFDLDAYWRVDVTNEDGLMLTSIHLSEVTAPIVGQDRRA